MSARQRNYREEERRRNERARAEGFSSRAQERGVRRKAQAWSDKHSHTVDSRYRPKMPSSEVAAYRDVYLSKDKGWRSMGRREAPPAAVKHWYVNVLRRYSSDEWDRKYGPPGGTDPVAVEMESLFGGEVG